MMDYATSETLELLSNSVPCLTQINVIELASVENN